jgi:hypothetical protein
MDFESIVSAYSTIRALAVILVLDPLDIVPAVAQVECLQDIVPPR